MRAWWLTAIGTMITGFCYSLQKYLKRVDYNLPERVAYYNDGVAFYFKKLLFLLFLRSFVFEWAIVPSESLKPTLLVGDRLLTDKSVYGIRLPITGHLLIPWKKPKRGDVIVFRSPIEPSNTEINRLIGLPGDKIQYFEKQLIINGKQASKVAIGIVDDQGIQENFQSWLLSEENLEGCIHQIYTHPRIDSTEKCVDITVPLGHYFVMGDHRDSSIDSRVWGCIPDRYLLGKAKRIYLSRNRPAIWWKPQSWMSSIRWNRLGMKIK
jgi:signal peptidase I